MSDNASLNFLSFLVFYLNLILRDFEAGTVPTLQMREAGLCRSQAFV